MPARGRREVAEDAIERDRGPADGPVEGLAPGVELDPEEAAAFGEEVVRVEHLAPREPGAVRDQDHRDAGQPGRVPHVEDAPGDGKEAGEGRSLAVAGEGDVPRALGAGAEVGEDARELGGDVGGGDRFAPLVPGDRAAVDHLAVDAVEVAGLPGREVDPHREAARAPRADDVDEPPPGDASIVSVRDALLTHGGSPVVS